MKAPPISTTYANTGSKYFVAHQEPISIRIAKYGTITMITRNERGVSLKLKMAPVRRNMMLMPNKWICDTRANCRRLDPVSVTANSAVQFERTTPPFHSRPSESAGGASDRAGPRTHRSLCAQAPAVAQYEDDVAQRNTHTDDTHKPGVRPLSCS